MKYRSLGKTDMQVSEISLGTWAIGGPYWTEGEPTGWAGKIDESEVTRAINVAIDKGVNHFDTADVYGYGRSERLLAKALGKRRSGVTIASKVGWAATTAPHVYDPPNIRHQCEQSLRNLDADTIDLYYFHHCDFGAKDSYLEDAIDTVRRLQEEGKIRYVGLSGYSDEEFARVVPKLEPDVLQGWADIEHDEFIRVGSPLRKLLDTHELGFVAMMPLGQGRLLGKYSSANPPHFGPGDNRQDSPAFSAEQLAELEPRLEALRQRFGGGICDLARVALQFVLAQPVVGCVIPGFRNVAQVKCNLKAAAKPLSADDVAYVLEVFPREEMSPHPWAE
jgi:aryl-alcohol dehydrogenase-like predicted oxidoreductase